SESSPPNLLCSPISFPATFGSEFSPLSPFKVPVPFRLAVLIPPHTNGQGNDTERKEFITFLASHIIDFLLSAQGKKNHHC
ncbi:hypothetical protein LINPERHAP2_LOCUS19763, partial [Linum perenne]